MKTKTFVAIREYVAVVTDTVIASGNFGSQDNIKRLQQVAENLLTAISEETPEE
mgnify:CR=1 FL=1